MYKMLLNIPEDLLEETDSKARLSHLGRSEAVRQALRLWVREDEPLPPQGRPGFQKHLTRIESVRLKAPLKGPKKAKADGAARWVRADRDSR